MIQKLEIFIIDRDLFWLVQGIGFSQGLIEDIEEPLHTELVHLVNLEQLCHCKV